jgi:hypothetical protein
MLICYTYLIRLQDRVYISIIGSERLTTVGANLGRSV